MSHSGGSGDVLTESATATRGMDQPAGRLHPSIDAAAAAFATTQQQTATPSQPQQPSQPASTPLRAPRTPSSVSFAEYPTPPPARSSAQAINGLSSTPTYGAGASPSSLSASPSPSAVPAAAPLQRGILKVTTPRTPLPVPLPLPITLNGVHGSHGGGGPIASALTVPSPRQGPMLAVALPPTIDVALSELHPRPLTPSPSAGASPVPSRLLPVPIPLSPNSSAMTLMAQHHAHSYPNMSANMNGTAVSAVPVSAASVAHAAASTAGHLSAPRCSCDPAFSTPAASSSLRAPLAHTPQQPAPVPPLSLPLDSSSTITLSLPSPPAQQQQQQPQTQPQPPFCMPPMLPSTRLIFKQLQQSSLWDRLFTHCTGRDLLAKIVQHGCGLLRCLLRLWEWSYRRLVQHAAFRRMFCKGADVKSLLSFSAAKAALGEGLSADSTAAAIAPPSASASAAPASSHSIAIVSLLPTSGLDASSPSTAALAPSAPPSASASADDDLDVFAPPCDSSSFSTRLAHISYTMYRARQVLRLGRWLYDIPDVRDSALELWGGVTEEKSAETQEAEEEWEEHERVHVVRSRRASFDASSMRADGSRGTFTFPLSARTPAMSPGSLSPRSAAEKQQQQQMRGSAGSNGSASAANVSGAAGGRSSRVRASVIRSASADALEQMRDRSGSTSLASTEGSSSASSTAHHATRSVAAFAGPYGDEDDPDEAADEEDEEDDDGPSLLEWSVGVIDLTNSLMGLLIDASDDLDFISSVGLLPERVGEIAGQVSSYLWLVSGGVDVAMCCWKLYEYRCEMREQLREQVEEWRERQQKLQLSAQSQPQQPLTIHMHNTSCPVHSCNDAAAPSSWRATHSPLALSIPTTPAASSSRSIATAASAAAVVSASSTPAAAAAASDTLSSLSLCSSACDVDCVHIESLRLFRYLGELGLSLCGLVELRGGLAGDGVTDLRLEGIMEASGLVSGLATFVKRGATHARSKSVVQRAESNANMMQLALYS